MLMNTLMAMFVMAATAGGSTQTAQLLPDLTHYEIFTAPEMVVGMVLLFLNGESRAKSWKAQVEASSLTPARAAGRP